NRQRDKQCQETTIASGIRKAQNSGTNVGTEDQRNTLPWCNATFRFSCFRWIDRIANLYVVIQIFYLRSSPRPKSAQRCTDFRGENLQALAQQVLWDGQRWQQADHIAVDTTGQDKNALLLTC